MRLGHVMHVEPSFVLYALRLDPGCCLRARTVLRRSVQPVGKKNVLTRRPRACDGTLWRTAHAPMGPPMSRGSWHISHIHLHVVCATARLGPTPQQITKKKRSARLQPDIRLSYVTPPPPRHGSTLLPT